MSVGGRRAAAKNQDSELAASVARPLLRWFRRHRRDLPWRRTNDPYAIWISEAMLQQTQVVTVISYYERFLRRFPTVQALADAPLDDVLQLWAGLGYYARGRNLHAAAKAIVRDFEGSLPNDVERLLTLPGVGDYTAGAVASIAFGERATVVDGNVTRVVARLFAIRDDIRAPATRRKIRTLAESMLPQRSCGDFNQALMELGATVCTPASPGCMVCPLRSSCRANLAGLLEEIPHSVRRISTRSETHVVLAIESGGQWLFLRRPEKGLWGGLWELPSERVEPGDELPAARRLLRRMCGPAAVLERPPFARIERQLTHRRITFVAMACRSKRRSEVANGQWRSLNKLNDLALSQAMQAVLEALRGHLERASARAAPA